MRYKFRLECMKLNHDTHTVEVTHGKLKFDAVVDAIKVRQKLEKRYAGSGITFGIQAVGVEE